MAEYLWETLETAHPEVAAREAKSEPVVAPGLPPCVSDPAAFRTEDCVQPPPLVQDR